MVKSHRFSEEADAAPRRRVPEWPTEHGPASARSAHESHGDMKGGSLPRSIRPEESEDLARLDAEREVTQRSRLGASEKTPVALSHAIELERGRHGLILA